MIEKKSLEEWLVDDWVMFDKWGNHVEATLPAGSGLASLLVEEVTDALKSVDDDHVSASVDRSMMWKVAAIVLNKSVVDQLPEGSMTVDDLLDAVKAAGHTWQISPISSP